MTEETETKSEKDHRRLVFFLKLVILVALVQILGNQGILTMNPNDFQNGIKIMAIGTLGMIFYGTKFAFGCD